MRSPRLVAICLSGLTRLAAAEDAPAKPPVAADPAPTPPVAAPPAEATPPRTNALRLRPGAWILAELGVRAARDGSRTRTFQTADVPRAFLTLDAERDAVFGRIVAEAVRAEQEGAVTGVAGDSLVFRAREAWGGAKLGDVASGRLGVVPLTVIPFVDEGVRARALGPTLVERAKLLFPADVGGTASVFAPGGYGELRLSVTAGEGYAQRERNDGKDTEAAVRVRPFPGSGLPVELLAAYSVGSRGTGRTRANRASGALVWLSGPVRGGAMVTHASGAFDDGKRTAWVGEVFVRVEPYRRSVLLAKAGRLSRGASGDTLDVAALGVGWMVGQGAEVLGVVGASAPSDRALAAMPGQKFQEARLVGSFRFEETP